LIRIMRNIIRSQGIASIPREIVRRIFKIKTKGFKDNIHLFQGRYGLEIGGPSSFFNRGRLFPLYPLVRLDNCIFSTNIIWGGQTNDEHYFYDRDQPSGNQYICDATDMKIVPSGKYDFVIASHVLEHIANPIKALRECMRVVKENGIVILVIPQKERTFDHKRPVTTLEHLIQDDKNNTPENDLTHLPEILELHDLKRDSVSKDRTYFEKKCKENAIHRYMHQHVFDKQLAVDLVSYMGLQVLSVEIKRPYHIFLIAQKMDSDQMFIN
jgi:SAM-dependent methyltransferase